MYKEDIVLDSENKRLIIQIKYSNPDPLGKGAETYVYDNDNDYSPYKLFVLLKDFLSDNQLIVDRSSSALRHHLKVIIKHIGLDPNEYFWHSFRRGGAHQAAIIGISDSDIKKHGRWLSEAYVRYTHVEPEIASLNISSKI